ncbi:hypothetical protein TIFTF001_007930 [Ficus carica]|uniref:Uncharacterized protein n=1 Tax=Ficus carica TaxID=3494 RepID=A0AA87ZKF5_FICCA|nr:hypothetical protein TIFTF001_007930 [Ficus carica]
MTSKKTKGDPLPVTSKKTKGDPPPTTGSVKPQEGQTESFQLPWEDSLPPPLPISASDGHRAEGSDEAKGLLSRFLGCTLCSAICDVPKRQELWVNSGGRAIRAAMFEVNWGTG